MDIFEILGDRVESNAKNAVESYVTELSEYQRAQNDRRLYGQMMDFAVLIRRRSIDLARKEQPLLDEDLSVISSIGRQRGLKGFSELSQQNVVTLHTGLMVREIGEAPAGRDVDGLLRMVNWFSAQAGAARGAYILGFEEGRSRVSSLVARVQSCTRMLLAGDPAAVEVARSLGLPVAGRYTVAVLRIPASSPLPEGARRAALLEALLTHHRVPLLWRRAAELVALFPAEGAGPDGREVPAAVELSALSLARDVTAAVGRACSVGVATGPVTALGGAAERARLVSRAAPLSNQPHRAHTTADVFVELGLAQLPDLDHWLRERTGRLSDGPDLITTLDAYYRADMNRATAAAALHVHPRTLDYRLRRVRTLTGIDPGSTQGVRLLSAAVARLLAGGWT